MHKQNFAKFCSNLIEVGEVKNWEFPTLKCNEKELNRIIKDLNMENDLKIVLNLPFSLQDYNDSLISYVETMLSDLKDIKDYLKQSAENSSPLKNFVNPIRNHDKKLDSHAWKAELDEGLYRQKCLYYHLFHESIEDQIQLVEPVQQGRSKRLLFYFLYLFGSGALIYFKKMPIFYMSLVVPFLFECFLFVKGINFTKRIEKTHMHHLKPVLSEIFRIFNRHAQNWNLLKKNLKELNDSQLYGIQSVPNNKNSSMEQVVKSFDNLKLAIK